jgi:hypothetical protein
MSYRLTPVPDNHPIRYVAIELNGLVFRLPPPNRHHDVIKALSELGLPWPIQGLQGFVDAHGVFLDRLAAGRACGFEEGEPLFSEDLW